MILKDKIIIVTGGSGLIGREIVDDIKRKGGYAINADINVSTDLSNGTINVDVSDSASIRNAVEEIYTYFGHIHERKIGVLFLKILTLSRGSKM